MEVVCVATYPLAGGHREAHESVFQWKLCVSQPTLQSDPFERSIDF